jgi:integrase
VGAILEGYVNASRERHAFAQIKGKAANVSKRLGWLHVADLRQSHVRTYIAQRRQDGVADGTIREELAKLRAAIHWGVVEGLCEPRPIKIPLAQSLRVRWLTREECGRLLEAATLPHVRLSILLALHTAGRVGAIRDLTWDRVDFDRRIVDLGHKPGGKVRAVVPMTRTLETALRAAHGMRTTVYVIEYAGRRLKSGRTGWINARARSGVVDVWRHDLRRTAGSLMLQDGVSITQVAAFLGHKSERTTERVYAHLSVEHLRAAADSLDRDSAREPQRDEKPLRVVGG